MSIEINQDYSCIEPLVEIWWYDHYSLGDDWVDIDHKHTDRILSAVGYLTSEDEKYYYVYCTYDACSKQYSAGTAVLKSCVIKMFNRSRQFKI